MKAETRKLLSQVVAYLSPTENDRAANINVIAAEIEGAEGDVIVPMGTPVAATATGFKVYNGSISGEYVDPVSGKAYKAGIIIGDRRGTGFNSHDIVLPTGGKDVFTILVNGEAGVIYDGVDFDGQAEDPFKKQMANQGVLGVAQAPTAETTYLYGH